MRGAVLGALASVVLWAMAPAVIAQVVDEPLGPNRDFSGVWVSYRDPDARPAAAGPIPMPPAIPFTEEGKRRRAEYDKITFNDGSTPGSLGGDNPGAHCVPYGMPSMMQSAGGYPIEFIQKGTAGWSQQADI